jgi:signal transduction histidine kinase
VAAHELRTPITTVKGYAQMLQRTMRRGALDEERLARSLDALVGVANRLTGLTSDLLDVGRLRTGQLALRREQADLAALVRSLAERFQTTLDDTHRLVLAAPAAPCAACTAAVDVPRVEQVFDNLLDNAVKYSPEGGEVRIDVRPEGSGVAVSVRDSGIGLPPGAAEQIFEPFGRAANATERNVPGMGLGLYVCRGIVEQHGGWIRAESPGDGQGTTITVWLPSAAPASATAPQAAPERTAGSTDAVAPVGA